LISGLVFAFLHVASYGDFVQVIPYAFMGLAFSYIYFYSGRNLYVVIAIHMINNLIPYLLYSLEIV
nr:CPBP family intramembrane metalloprotease [Mycoplasmatota bacterium]